MTEGEPTTVTAAYGYDADGLKRSRTVNGESTGYLWAAGELLEERLPGNSVLYANAAGMVVSAGGDRLAHDGLGSVVGVVGATSTTRKYDAWGGFVGGTAPTSAQPSVAYAGQAFDVDLGLSYAQQRWYDAGTGRFLSTDPVGVTGRRLKAPGELGRWLYATENPIRFTDPSGAVVYDVKSKKWRVEDGDTLDTVASDTGFDVHDIMGENGFSGEVCLAPGSQIRVPQTKRVRAFEAAASSIGSGNWMNSAGHTSEPMRDCMGTPVLGARSSNISVSEAVADRCNVAVIEWTEECGGQRIGRLRKRSRNPFKMDFWKGYDAAPLAEDLADAKLDIPGLRVRRSEQKPKIGDIVAGSHLEGHGGHAVVYAGNIRIRRADGQDARTAARAEEPLIQMYAPTMTTAGRIHPSEDATIGTSGDDQRIRLRDTAWTCATEEGTGQETFMCDPSTWPVNRNNPFVFAGPTPDPASGWKRAVRTSDGAAPAVRRVSR